MTDIICERTDCVHNAHKEYAIDGKCTSESISLEDQMHGLLECHSYEEEKEGSASPSSEAKEHLGSIKLDGIAEGLEQAKKEAKK